MKKLKLCSIFLVICVSCFYVPELSASNTSEVYISCTVDSFGGYSFKGVITRVVNELGKVKIGTITVDGSCNEPYPWILRIYTDNKNYQSTAGALYTEKIPQGLIREGGGSIPLMFQTPNTGNEWVYVPDINDPNYKTYYAIRDVGPDKKLPDAIVGESVLVGIDPRNATWVAGQDHILFTDDDNIYGDNTLPTPFEIHLAVQIPENIPKEKSIPHGTYSTKLVFEIISEP